MLTPLRISTLCVGLTAVLSTTLLVADSTTATDDGEGQTISASADTDAPSNGSDEIDPTEQLLVVADLSRTDRLAEDGATEGETSADAVTEQDSIQDSTVQDSKTESDADSGDQNSSSDDPETPPSGSNPSTTQKTQVTTKSESSQEESNEPTQTSTTTAPSTTAAPATPSRPAQASAFEPMRNSNGKFSNYASTPSNQLNASSLMEPVSPVDHGGNGTGQFRIACEYSHFNYDDPIVFPGQPGKSHFHMFFGNTEADAYTDKNSLVNSGGGSCNGFELNRSAYWTPALLDGKGNAIVPDQIIIYYKTKKPNEVQPMPQGLQIIGGNASGQDFSPKETLFWSCGSSGHSYNHTNRIPSCGGDAVNATIAFPQCWDGKNLTSSDFTSHMKEISESSSCPSSHPVRLPQLTYLLYFPPGDTSTWYLSSDRSGGFNTGPGATLHADWMGAWHTETMNLWLDTCVRRGRNCSYGQTGTPQKLAALNPLQTFAGNNTVPIPK